ARFMFLAPAIVSVDGQSKRQLRSGQRSGPGAVRRLRCELRGPEMTAAEILSAVVPRSARYVFLVKQTLHETSSNPIDLELEARGQLPSSRALAEYVLRLLGYSDRTARRILDVLYGGTHKRAR